jgi:membrane protein YqaA with SNARE-associated domain
VTETDTAERERTRDWSRGIACSWGLAEATFFFIVPDVFLTRLALRDFCRAVGASAWAVAGALVGGSGLWFAARHGNAGALLRLFERLPGINAGLVERSGEAFGQQGLAALFKGVLRGYPYKLFAVHAGAGKVPFVAFLAASACARFLRFTAAITVAWVAGRALGRRSVAFRYWVHAAFWLTFYAAYFLAMHNIVVPKRVLLETRQFGENREQRVMI